MCHSSGRLKEGHFPSTPHSSMTKSRLCREKVKEGIDWALRACGCEGHTACLAKAPVCVICGHSKTILCNMVSLLEDGRRKVSAQDRDPSPTLNRAGGQAGEGMATDGPCVLLSMTPLLRSHRKQMLQGADL